MGEIETGTKEQDTREKNRIGINRFCCDVKRVLTPSE